MSESRTRYLAKNTAIFAVGNLASKLITFFLVPLYTNALNTTEYGTIDLVSTICYVLAPVLILNISESVMRFSLDKDADYEEIISIGVRMLIISFAVGLLLVPIAKHVNAISQFAIYIYFFIITNSASQLFLYYLRGKEKLMEYTIGNVLHTFTIGIFNIIFLIYFKQGVVGYFKAYIFSSLVTAIYALIKGNVIHEAKLFKINSELCMNMLKYSIVLIPNTFMWWIMNSSDRIMVTGMVGADANGVYAISYKLPTLVSTITMIFNQAWSYSAIREEGANDEDEYNNSILKKLVCFVFMIGIAIITFCKPFLKIYVAEDYYVAWKYTPFLVIGCVYLTLATFMATTYTVHKDSFGYLFSGMFGAVLNVILNFILIPIIGVYGAALATCVSYIAVFGFRLIHTKKYIRFNFLFKEYIIGAVIIAISGSLLFCTLWYASLLQLILFITVLFFYAPTCLPLIKRTIEKKIGK